MSQSPLAIGSVQFPLLEDSRRLALLAPPAVDRPIDVVLDTDTFNEIDDQFALAHAMLSTDRLNMQAIYAAPFSNRREYDAANAVAKSHDEILRVLDALGQRERPPVLRGAPRFLPACDQPVESDAARDLVARAMQPRTGPLYVLAIAAPTNVASAILMEPAIIDRIVVVWLGGNPLDWHTAREFNLKQDPYATHVLLDSGVPLLRVPCKLVAEQLRVSVAELDFYIRGRSGLGDFFTDMLTTWSQRWHSDKAVWSKVMWDTAVIAWMIEPAWVPSELVPTPLLTSELTWSRDGRRHLMREAVDVSRDLIFADFFRKVIASG